MKHVMRSSIILIVIILCQSFFVNITMATDQTAASCSADDIQTAINALVTSGGGTVTLPACDKDGAPADNGALWGDGDNICIDGSVEIRVLGAGQELTDIGYATGAKGDYTKDCPSEGTSSKGSERHMIHIYGTGIKELGQLTISGASDIGTSGIYWRQCTDRTCDSGATNVRVHHMGIKNISANGRGIYFCQNWKSTTVMDHMYIGDQVTVGAYGISVNGGWEAESFVVPPAFGTDNGLFIEDSTFNNNYHPIASFYAARLTARYNTFSNNTSALEGHGAPYTSGCGYGDPAERNGSYRYEVYNNTWIDDRSYAIMPRSGFWIFTDNTVNANSSSVIRIDPDAGMTSGRANCADTSNDCPYASQGYASTEECYQGPIIYQWNNDITLQGDLYERSSDAYCVRQGNELLERAPQAGDSIVTSYAKYTYPHPLASGEAPIPAPPNPAPSFPTNPDIP